MDVADWERERDELLGRRISELGLAIAGTRVERLAEQLHRELEARGIAFRPPIYLSDEWGCPDGTPLIAVPFYLADPRLERIEAEMSGGIEDDAEAMRYLRHEAGHAINYAFRFHDREDWTRLFGPIGRAYRDRYRVDPFSRLYVRHILGWYAQKHPDEDFAETFAVWLTPGSDWREEYVGWPALEKLEYVDALMREIASFAPAPVSPTHDDLPVDAMDMTVAGFYEGSVEPMPIDDPRQFDRDLRRIFHAAADAPQGEPAGDFVRRHLGEIVGRITYWSAEPASTVRSLMLYVAQRAAELGLRVGTLEAATLIEITAFGMAVAMLHREGKLSRTPRWRSARPAVNRG
jgi:hypothetical protein